MSLRLTPFGDFRFLRDEHGIEAFYNFGCSEADLGFTIHRSERHPDLYYHGVETWD